MTGETALRVLFVERELSYEPQGIMSMSAVLKQAGHDVALTVESMEDPVAYAAEYQPDIVGYSVMTGSQRAFFDLNLQIRQAVNPAREAAGKKPVFSAFGGPHPTFFPEMITEPGVDGICIGEGEGAHPRPGERAAATAAFQPGHPELVVQRRGRDRQEPGPAR